MSHRNQVWPPGWTVVPRVGQRRSQSGEQSEFDEFVEHEKKDATLDSSLEVGENSGRMYKLVNRYIMVEGKNMN